jgi:hypothetical protein
MAGGGIGKFKIAAEPTFVHCVPLQSLITQNDFRPQISDKNATNAIA